MILGKIFTPSMIKVPLEAEDKEEVWEELVDLFVSHSGDAGDRSVTKEIIDAVRERETKLSTGIKTGIAVPHARIASIKEICGVIGLSPEGLDYDALDGEPVHAVFLVLSPDGDCFSYLRVLRRLALLMEMPDFYPSLIKERTPEGAHSVICRFEDELTESL